MYENFRIREKFRVSDQFDYTSLTYDAAHFLPANQGVENLVRRVNRRKQRLFVALNLFAFPNDFHKPSTAIDRFETILNSTC